MFYIQCPTRRLPDEIKAMPDGTPAEAAAKNKAVTEFWSKTMFVRYEVPVELQHQGAVALMAFQRQCEADALATSAVPSEG